MPGAKNTLHVIVADDELQICALVRETLSQMGHHVQTARDGEEALKLFEQEKEVGLLVLDVLMPIKTGVEVLQELRRRGELVPVVLMSSFLPEEVLASCAGFDRVAFLQKPFSLAEFRTTVEKVTRPVRC